VALEGGYGLIVPVLRNADEKNVVGCSAPSWTFDARPAPSVEADEVRVDVLLS